MCFIDLHVHSNASDGTLSPREVVLLAQEAGLSAIALTDHDTTAGTAEAMAAGEEAGVRVIPGIEVSSSYENKELHILGLFVHPGEAGFEDFLKAMRARRDRRNEEMLARFARDGITFTQEELTSGNPDTVITRAHVARALLARGAGSSREQIFKKYLQYGGRYCPLKEHFPPEEVVRILLENGAFVSLAHPFQYRLGDRATEQLIARLASLGMQGLEVYHSSHNPLEVKKLSSIARRLRLLPTGGSDFHGANKPDIQIGTGRGGLRLPISLLEDIEKRLAGENR